VQTGELGQFAKFVLAITSNLRAGGIVQRTRDGDFAMTTIMLKLTRLNLLSGFAGTNLESLSDRSLQDIGFKLDRRNLDAVKPFWMA
jgi:hypothetical protein